VSNQVIIAEGGIIIDIRHEAIHKQIEMRNIKDKKDCFEKVVHLFSEFQKQVNTTAEVL
jgi:hypothetical protein